MLDHLTNGLTEENLTFAKSENLTRYIELPISINVSVASIIHKGDLNTINYSWCYQEFANKTTGCGGVINITKPYKFASTWIPDNENLIDGDFGTYARPEFGADTILYTNYTKPDRATNNSIWTVGPASITGALERVNLTIPSMCWDYNPNILSVRVISTNMYSYGIRFQCRNNTGWYQILRRDTANDNAKRFYDEGMFWLMGSYPANVSLEVGDLDGSPEWQHSNYYNVTKLINLTEKINSLLPSCSCTNCTLSGTNCTIPLTYHSDTPGVLELSNINITYSYMLNISIYNQLTGNLIDTQSVTTAFISDEHIFSLITTSGKLNTDGLQYHAYTITFEAENYTKGYYQANPVNGDSELMVYLLPDTETNEVILITRDEDSTLLIEGALIKVYRVINDIWTLIIERETDVTGSIKFNYEQDEEYSFITTKDGYKTKSFELEPIEYPSYNVWLEKNSTSTNNFDYDSLMFTYEPNSFRDNQITYFNFTLLSPLGELEYYGFNLTFNTSINGSLGTTAIGSELTTPIKITNAVPGDVVLFEYYYKKFGSDRKEFSLYLDVYNISTEKNTLMRNSEDDYGLTLYERVLIAVFIVIFIVGVFSYFMGAVVGGVLGLAMMGIFVQIKFIDIWVFMVSIVMLVFYIIWRSKS